MYLIFRWCDMLCWIGWLTFLCPEFGHFTCRYQFSTNNTLVTVFAVCCKKPWGQHLQQKFYIYIISQPLLLFIGKEWTNMAVPRGAQIWSKIILLFINIGSSNKQKRKWCWCKYFRIFFILRPACVFWFPFEWISVLHLWGISFRPVTWTSICSESKQFFC